MRILTDISKDRGLAHTTEVTFFSTREIIILTCAGRCFGRWIIFGLQRRASTMQDTNITPSTMIYIQGDFLTETSDLWNIRSEIWGDMTWPFFFCFTIFDNLTILFYNCLHFFTIFTILNILDNFYNFFDFFWFVLKLFNNLPYQQSPH